MSEEKISRYPGMRSFSKQEQSIFFGRSKEVQELYELVRVQNVVVMFAKSGMGKTSLLNAGLIPILEEVAPIEVRFQDTKISPLEKLKKAALDYINHEKADKYSNGVHNPWEIFKSRELTPFVENKTPLLIFDQFEEFFTHDFKDRNEFRKEIAHFIENKVPDRVNDILIKVPRNERTHELLAWCSPIKVKILFVMRSDKFHLMDELSKEIKSIINHRFSLLPLTIEKAKEAIIEPAKLDENIFKVAPFEFDELLIDDMLSIKNSKGYVESWQLQLLCGSIEKQIILEKEEGNEITLAGRHFLGGIEGIEQILNDFYINKLDEIKNETEKDAAKYIIEEKLIFEGRRVRIDENVLLKENGVTKQLLKSLVANRLLRAETSDEFTSYEISHDMIVNSILRRKEYERELNISKEKTKIDWGFINKSIKEQKCVLIVGTQFFRNKQGNTFQKLMIDLSDLFQDEFRFLEDDGIFEIIDSDFHPVELKGHIVGYYKNQAVPFYYKSMIEFSFDTIISLAQDNLIQKCFDEEGKVLNEVKSTKYSNSIGSLSFLSGNNNSPILYDLFGNYNNLDSLTLTNQDVFKTIEDVNRIGLPREIEIKIKESNLILFLGVDFRKWYLKPILWKLLKNNNSVKYAMNSRNSFNHDLMSSVQSTFSISFFQLDSLEFFDILESNKNIINIPKLDFIHKQISDNKISAAIENLKKLINEFTNVKTNNFSKRLTLIQGRFFELRKRKNQGLISYENSRMEENKILKTLIDLVNQIKTNE